MTPNANRARLMAIGVWTGLVLVAGLLWSRRLVGEFTGPLPAGWVIAWTLLIAAVSAAAGWLLRGDRKSLAITAGIGVLTTLAGLPGLNATAVGILIGVWSVTALAVWVIQDGDALWSAMVTTVPAPSPILSPCPAVFDEPVDVEPEEPTDDALQTMARRVTEEGEVIEGLIRVELPAGEREATVHLSFCPPLAGPPTVEVEDADGVGWEVKVAAAYPFGLRLQVRRGRDCAAPVTGRIAYWACATTATKAA